MDYGIFEQDIFVVGKDDFNNLEIREAPQRENFYYFFDTHRNRLITKFILLELQQVFYCCQVVLIKKDGKFTPRITFTVRNKVKKGIEQAEIPVTSGNRTVKANINLDKCHENLWKLINFIQSLRDIDIPQDSFSLISQQENEIVSAIRGRDTESIIAIIKQLASTEGVSLSQEDVSELLKRKEVLQEFHTSLQTHSSDEGWWQDFFEEHKWIFGYGLNYQILRQEQAQPNFGGTRVDGSGGQRGDYLTSTMGDINFTVLVEIKTPATPLLQGTSEIRNGAWSLSKELSDAISQLQANMATWENKGSREIENIDTLEQDDIFTIEPKGILVLGSLNEIKTPRSKRETFQRFIKSIHGVDVITYDQLYERAKFITNKNASAT